MWKVPNNPCTLHSDHSNDISLQTNVQKILYIAIFTQSFVAFFGHPSMSVTTMDGETVYVYLCLWASLSQYNHTDSEIKYLYFGANNIIKLCPHIWPYLANRVKKYSINVLDKLSEKKKCFSFTNVFLHYGLRMKENIVTIYFYLLQNYSFEVYLRWSQTFT